MSEDSTYDTFLAINKALDEAKSNPKDRKMMLNNELQKSLKDTIAMIEMLGDNRLEVFFGEDKYVLTLKVVKQK